MSVHGQLIINNSLSTDSALVCYQPIPRWSVSADMAANAATVVHDGDGDHGDHQYHGDHGDHRDHRGHRDHRDHGD